MGLPLSGGTSAERPNRSMPSVTRESAGSAGLGFPVPGGFRTAPLWGTSAEQPKRSMPSSIRWHEGFGRPEVSPLWETSRLCLAAVRRSLSGQRLPSSGNAA